MRRFIKYLLPALLLALCLSLAACGSGGETDTDTDAAPDSFEGMVKDSDRMVSLSDYGGTWAGDDGSTMLVEAGGDGDEVRFALYDAGDEVTASGFIQFVPDYGCDYFYNEHDGVAYRSRLDEAGTLDVVSLGGDDRRHRLGDAGGHMVSGCRGRRAQHPRDRSGRRMGADGASRRRRRSHHGGLRHDSGGAQRRGDAVLRRFHKICRCYL